MKDIIIPIVFPDYKIIVDTPNVEFDLFPWFDFDNISIKPTKQKLSNLGHAGILIIEATTGRSKYYEYGRYDYPVLRGAVRRLPIPDAKTSKGSVVFSSLIPILHKISARAGKGSKIEGVFLESNNSFAKLNISALAIKSQNKNKKKKKI